MANHPWSYQLFLKCLSLHWFDTCSSWLFLSNIFCSFQHQIMRNTQQQTNQKNLKQFLVCFVSLSILEDHQHIHTTNVTGRTALLEDLDCYLYCRCRSLQSNNKNKLNVLWFLFLICFTEHSKWLSNCHIAQCSY